jgi:hypothetical protein
MRFSFVEFLYELIFDAFENVDDLGFFQKSADLFFEELAHSGILRWNSTLTQQFLNLFLPK